MLFIVAMIVGMIGAPAMADDAQIAKITNSKLAELKALPTSYPVPGATTVKTLFAEKRAELPKEMPIVEETEIEGSKKIFVDVKNGNDATATGAINKPFKTIKAALKKHPPQAGMVLYLREGIYPASDSVSLLKVKATEDNPFIISNYNGEEVTVTGGTTINGKDFEKITDMDAIQRLNPEVIDNILVVDLKEKYGMTEYGDITITSRPVLFVGDNQYTIARWPNSGNTNMLKYTGVDQEIGTNGYQTGVIDSGKITTSAGSNCGPTRQHSKRYQELLDSGAEISAEEEAAKTGFEFCVEELRPFTWGKSDDIWIYGKFYGDWTLEHYKLWKMNPEKRSIRTMTGLSYGCRYYNSTSYKTGLYYYNVFEELDNPGEWFMDKESGKLYVYPIGDIKNAHITYAYLNQTQLWDIVSCQNVVINGIKFDKATTRAITITKQSSSDASDSIVIQNCTFSNMNEGVYITASKYSGVINSTFKDLEGDAVNYNQSTGSELKNLIPARMFVQNSVFYNTGGMKLTGIGNIISHNLISNNKGTNISVSGNENIVEYNEFVAGPRVVEDSGCIYFNGNNLFRRGNHARYNYFHDLSSKGRSLYFDDMLSENYAYGNIVDGGWMQLHTGSDNTVYSNIFLNHTNSSGEGPVRISTNYWRVANTAGELWIKGTLSYSSFTGYLKASAGYGGNETNNTLTGAYAARYPRLKAWAELMYKRIDEYEENGKTSDAAKTSKYYSDYTHTYEKSGKTTTEQVNLNDWLSSSRDNYFGNNVMINCAPNVIDNPKSEGKYPDVYDYQFAYSTSNPNNTTKSGIIRTVDENNVYLTSSENPFKDKDFSNADEKLASYIKGFEEIPFDKIGLLNEADYVKNGKVTTYGPADTTDALVSAKDLSLNWSSVAGAQEYTVELAKDAEFKDILESKTTYDLSHKVETALKSDTVYYWRVKTKSTARCATGDVEVSDTFKFKTMSEKTSKERNQVGATIYSVDDTANDRFKVTTYAYNGTNAEKKATIYIACYDKNNKLTAVDRKIVTIPADKGLTEENENNTTASDEIAYKDADFQDNSFSDKIVFDFAALRTNKIKLFVWDAEGNIVPYTFVKTLSRTPQEGYVSTALLEKAIQTAESFYKELVEGEAGDKPTYKVGAKAKLDKAIKTAKTVLDSFETQEEVDAAANALNTVVEDIKNNYANEWIYTFTSLDISQWKNVSPLAKAELTDDGIVVTPDLNESAVFAFNQPLTAKQKMKFSLKYHTVGDWHAIATRQVDPDVIPTRSKGYFFVIKDDLIEFQKYQAKSNGKILAKTQNNGQIKSGETCEIEVGSVNVEGGVLSTLKVNGNTVLEYLDTDNPIYEQGYFLFYAHKTLGPVTISTVK